MFVMNLIFRLPSFFSSDELNFLISVTNWGQMVDWKTWFPNAESWNSLGIPLGKSLEIFLGNQALSKSAFVHSPQKGETHQKTFTSKKNTRSYKKTLIWSWLFLGDCWTHVQCTIVHCVHEKCICATFCVHCLAKAHFSDQWIYLPNCDTCLRVRCQNINPIHTFGLFSFHMFCVWT